MSYSAAHHDHAHDDHTPTGWKRWLFSTNHKDIGAMYLVFAIVAGLIGTLFSVLIRIQLSHPNGTLFGDNYQLYNVVVTALDGSDPFVTPQRRSALRSRR